MRSPIFLMACFLTFLFVCLTPLTLNMFISSWQKEISVFGLIEAGININPTIETLRRIAKALSVSVEDLIK